MTLDRIFIVHHGLVDRHAHYFGEALGWLDACRARGIKPHLYVNAKALPSIVERLGARPVFPYAPDANVEADPRCRQLSDYLLLGNGFARACRALESDGVGANDLVVVPFASERDVFGAAIWLEQLPAAARPVLAFTFMVPDFRWQVSEDRSKLMGDISYYAYAGKRILGVLPARRLLLNGIDKRFRKTVAAAMQHPCGWVPLGTYFPDEAELSAPDDEPEFPHVHVGVAGEFRPEKGSDLVPEVLLRFAKLRPGRAVALQVADETQAMEMDDHFRRSAIDSPFFLYAGWADHRAYLRRLLRTDILLLPYHWHRYAIRPSGVFSEAVGYGIVPVVPDRTWAADQLASGWGAGTTFAEFSAEAMIEALVKASDDISVLKAKATFTKQAWRDAHSTAALLDRLLEQARWALTASP